MASYSFLSKNEMVASNRKHLNHDYLTDIITFNYSESARLNVELLISYDYIFEQSALSARNLVDEVDRVLVHGLLHCMGFDDQNQGQQKLMREEEKKCLLLRPKKLKFRTIQ